MQSLRTKAQIALATFLEQCAQRRMQIAAANPQDASLSSRSLQAEAAGRYLMAALIQDDAFRHESVGSGYRLLVSYLATLLAASTPDECVAPIITARLHTVELHGAMALLLRDALLLILLATLDDEASEIDIWLKRGDGTAVLSIESDSPFEAKPHSALHHAQQEIVAAGGTWAMAPQPHGASWLAKLALPTQVQAVVPSHAC